MCVDGRARLLDNEATFGRLVSFLLDSPTRYHWFGRRFVIMPDHIHLIAHMGRNAVRVGQWIKAMKAVVGGLEPRGKPDHVEDRLPSGGEPRAIVGRVPPRGAPPTVAGRVPPRGEHEFSRVKRAWRWQDGFHDHKFRTPESESRKWDYVCLNPVRYGLVKRPEE